MTAITFLAITQPFFIPWLASKGQNYHCDVLFQFAFMNFLPKGTLEGSKWHKSASEHLSHKMGHNVINDHHHIFGNYFAMFHPTVIFQSLKSLH